MYALAVSRLHFYFYLIHMYFNFTSELPLSRIVFINLTLGFLYLFNLHILHGSSILQDETAYFLHESYLILQDSSKFLECFPSMNLARLFNILQDSYQIRNLRESCINLT